MLEDLKIKALAANLQLYKSGFSSYGYGNVSLIDRETGLIVTRPAGIPYLSMSCEDMLVLDLMGERVEGFGKPSDDIATHLELYKNFAELDAVAFVRPTFATAFAQAGRDIPFYGSLHADFFCGDIPCVTPLLGEEMELSAEKSIATAVAEEINGYSTDMMPAVLVRSIGAYVYSSDADKLFDVISALEETAKTAFLTEQLSDKPAQPDFSMLERKFNDRKR